MARDLDVSYQDGPANRTEPQLRRSRSTEPHFSSKRRKYNRSDGTSKPLTRDYREFSPDLNAVGDRNPATQGHRRLTSLGPSRGRKQRRNFLYNSKGASPDEADDAPKAQRDRNSLSDKIHSLRRLLENPHSNMPPDVRIEKERELAGYLLDQQKATDEKFKRKQIQRYHFVRFMERKKAERNLKRLSKEKQNLQSTEPPKPVPPSLDKDIHEAEVDLAYTLYAPLAAKYIGVFAQDPGKKQIYGVKKQVLSSLSEEQFDQLVEARNEGDDILHNQTGMKPPAWYEVEKALGNEQALERLKYSTGHRTEVTLIDGRNTKTPGDKESDSQPEWMQDADLMSDADSQSDDDDDDGGGVAVQDDRNENPISEDEFFEKVD